ncbi:MAG: PAS domain S-box protein [Desulfobacterales bacterium]|nr:PAS domain S-box protein [Desulfobacterales bacterium]
MKNTDLTFLKNQQILVIDDTTTNLKVVASILTENGYNVLVATNGKQGISIAKVKLPDLILLDIMMPGMDGYEVCENLKSDEQTKNIPVIFLTAAVEVKDVVKGFQYGAIDYITKPFNQAELLARVETHLELKISKEIINEQKQELDFAISGSNIGVWIWNLTEKWLRVSDTFIEILGNSTDDFSKSYLDILALIHPDDINKTEALLKNVVNGELEKFDIEFRIKCNDGKYRWILSKAKVLKKDHSEKPVQIIGTHIDITKIKFNEEQIRLLSMAVQQSANSIIITDSNCDIIFVNKHFLTTTGYTEKEIIGKNPRFLKAGKQPQEFYKKLWDTISAGKEWHGEFCNIKKNGEIYWDYSTITPIKDESNKILYYIGIHENITQKKKMEEDLYYYSTIDSLTDVYNRRTGIELLKKQIYLAKRQNKILTVCFIDLNDLKYVNDKFGHNQGDTYIKLVVDNTKSILRISDILTRLGGDEFLIILPECRIDESKEVLKRVTERLSDINQSKAFQFKASISYGFAEYDPNDEPDYENLIAIADDKMYKHKCFLKQV